MEVETVDRAGEEVTSRGGRQLGELVALLREGRRVRAATWDCGEQRRPTATQAGEAPTGGLASDFTGERLWPRIIHSQRRLLQRFSRDLKRERKSGNSKRETKFASSLGARPLLTGR